MDTTVHHLDKGESVCAAFLYLRKVFDSLHHCILLSQLSTAVLRWFQDYLTGRIHHVKCNQQFSPWAAMKGGIPQGSAVGPLFLNQARPRAPGFLKLLWFARRYACVSLCLSVCPPPRPLMTGGMIWCDIGRVRLVKP